MKRIYTSDFSKLTQQEQEAYDTQQKTALAKELKALSISPLCSLRITVCKDSKNPFAQLNRLKFWAHKAHKNINLEGQSKNSKTYTVNTWR